MVKDGYTPRTWHTHPLHLCPPEPYDPAHPGTRATLDWIFLISSLNFSFWSQYDGTECCYGVEWREGWGSEHRVVHTGYWSLVAALNRGMCAVIRRRFEAFLYIYMLFFFLVASAGRGYPDHRPDVLCV